MNNADFRAFLIAERRRQQRRRACAAGAAEVWRRAICRACANRFVDADSRLAICLRRCDVRSRGAQPARRPGGKRRPPGRQPRVVGDPRPRISAAAARRRRSAWRACSTRSAVEPARHADQRVQGREVALAANMGPRAQEAAALLAKLIEPSQCEGAAAPKHGSERRPLLEAAALLNSAGRRCENCGQELECCAFWPLTAGAGTADAPGGRRLLCCINCARAEGWWRVGEARSIQKREVCSFFAEGSCGEGGRCRFVHQDPNAARLAVPRAAGAPTSYPRSGESYISVLEVRVLSLGHPDLGSTRWRVAARGIAAVLASSVCTRTWPRTAFCGCTMS